MIFARVRITQAPSVVTVAVAPPSVDDEALPPYPHPHHNLPQLTSRLTGRLSVLEDSIRQQAFDTVQLCFRGMIASSVGGRTTVEDIITLTDIKTIDDFQPSEPTPTTNPQQNAHHAPFYFEIPTTVSSSSSTNNKLCALPLTGRVSGTTKLPSNGSLNDTRTIRGECDISYWIEAQFRQAGRQVGFISEPVRINPSLYTPRLHASLADQPVTLAAKPDLLSRCKKIHRTPASLSVTLYEPDMAISTDPSTGKRTVTLPLAISMDLAAAKGGVGMVDARQSIKCTADVKWQVHTRFSSAPGCAAGRRRSVSETVQKSTTASTHKSTVLFRPLPLYDDKTTHQKSYVATSQLDLAVPEAVSQPSLHWSYLSRTYMLDMTLNFHGLQGAPKYNLHSSIPLVVTAVGGSAADTQDILKDDIMVSIAEADGTDDELDRNPPPFLGTTMPTATATQTQTVVRRPTPPPPYFR